MKISQIAPLAIILFLINPMLSIVGLVLYGFTIGNNVTTDNNRSFLVLFGVLCSAAVSLINTTKVPDGDLLNYVYQYTMAGRLSYFSYLLAGSESSGDFIKEPVFYTLVWVMNRLFMGNVLLFQFGVSFLEFVLCVYAIVYFGKVFGMRLYVVMSGIVVMCFLPYIFIHSLNIIRQFLANSLLLFIIVRHFFYGRREWIAMLMMVLIHTTSIFFLPMLLLPVFGKPFKKSWIWFVGVIAVLVGFQFIAGVLLGFGNFSAVSAMGYALSRAELGNMGEYETSIVSIVASAVFLVYSFVVYMGKSIPVNEGLRRFSSTIIILSAFILLVQSQGLVANRFARYAFTFLPFLLMIFFQSRNTNRFVIFVVCLATMVFFSIFLYNNVFTFNVVVGGWITPVFGYMF